jgi:apolipoprotein N-acyltransferase
MNNTPDQPIETAIQTGTPTSSCQGSYWVHLAWAAGAIASFHAAFLSHKLAPVILLFPVCLIALTGMNNARHAFRWGVGIGLAVYPPHLAFFWGIFKYAAMALWMVLPIWLGVFLALATLARRRLGFPRALLLIPFLWTGVEFFRSELYPLKFSWLNFGYLFSAEPWDSPLHLLGMYGTGFLIVALASAAFLSRRILVRLGIVGLSIGLLSGLPWETLNRVNNAASASREIKMAGVQLEFPSESTVLRCLNRLVLENPSVDVLVLSEYTFDGPVPERVKEWCRANHRHLVVGGKDPVDAGRFHNTVFVIGPDGNVIFKQAKKMPIQFFQDGLPAPDQKLWESPWGKIGICICYDLSYTRVTDELIRQGAQVLIVPTMDVEDWGAAQHLLHGRVAPTRAAEYGVPIFRLASSGISQSIDGRGTVRSTAPFPVQGAFLRDTVVLSNAGTRPLDRLLAPVSVAATVLFAAGMGLSALRRIFKMSKTHTP